VPLRYLLPLLFATLVFAQLRERQEPPPEMPAHMEDEDESRIQRTEYAFNPIQARKEVQVGDFYARKGNHKAAVGRYLEATKWNPGYAEAYWKLAGSEERLDGHEEALSAYQKYLELEPDGKQSKEARAKIAEIESAIKAQATKDPS